MRAKSSPPVFIGENDSITVGGGGGGIFFMVNSWGNFQKCKQERVSGGKFVQRKMQYFKLVLLSVHIKWCTEQN
jgi:hypothetical protein